MARILVGQAEEVAEQLRKHVYEDMEVATKEDPLDNNSTQVQILLDFCLSKLTALEMFQADLIKKHGEVMSNPAAEAQFRRVHPSTWLEDKLEDAEEARSQMEKKIAALRKTKETMDEANIFKRRRMQSGEFVAFSEDDDCYDVARENFGENSQVNRSESEPIQFQQSRRVLDTPTVGKRLAMTNALENLKLADRYDARNPKWEIRNDLESSENQFKLQKECNYENQCNRDNQEKQHQQVNSSSKLVNEDVLVLNSVAYENLRVPCNIASSGPIIRSLSSVEGLGNSLSGMNRHQVPPVAMDSSTVNTNTLMEMVQSCLQQSNLVLQNQIAQASLMSASLARSPSNVGMLYPRLRDLPVPTFSGDHPHEFQNFWNEFNAAIGSRSDIRGSVKQQYLYQSLKDPARWVITGLEFSDDNYEVAKKELNQAYGSPAAIKEAYMDRLSFLAERKCQFKSSQLFRVFQEQNILIKNMTKHTVVSGAHARLIKMAYPWSFMERISEKEADYQEKYDDEMPVDKLLECIRIAIKVVQRKEKDRIRADSFSSSDIEDAEAHHVQSPNRNFREDRENREQCRYSNEEGQRFQNRLSSPNGGQRQMNKEIICAGCDEVGHVLTSCRQFVTLEERDNAVGSSKCRMCFRTGHDTSSCNGMPCKRCGGTHGLALCPQMYENGRYTGYHPRHEQQ